MRIITGIFLAFAGSVSAQTEPYLSNQTYTYEETIGQYKKMAADFPKYCVYQQIGSSDVGLPVSLFLINKSGKFTPREFDSKTVLLVNNGIHPGEPEGIDASIKLCKDLLADTAKIPDHVIFAVIPVFNIGGALNRNCCSRANQNGPEEYGFRGNAKNLDLNRDFIKADSKNVFAFYTIFHTLKPAVFIDTHTSNGADYQYVMTLITSQTDKMNPVLAEYVNETMNPYLYKEMDKKGFPMIPYVHARYELPDSGIVDFLETPRYSTGYTNLFNTIGFVAETHMLKPFDQRVEATYDLLEILLAFVEKNHEDLKGLRTKADEFDMSREYFGLNWELDTTRYDKISFSGYEAKYKKSEVTGADRLYYDRSSPYKKKIRYYNRYVVTDSVTRPACYIIPQAWDNVIENLRKNQVPVFRAKSDFSADAEAYDVLHYETVKGPYEGHYLHHSFEVEKYMLKAEIRTGDFVIPTDNNKVRFIIETLEPLGVDSYLAWNYFDATLQQKEWFSAYVFEDEAPGILAANPELKKEFEEKKKNDPEFAANAFAQLYFIYKGSDHYEPTHNRYPVLRLSQMPDAGLLQEYVVR